MNRLFYIYDTFPCNQFMTVFASKVHVKGATINHVDSWGRLSKLLFFYTNLENIVPQSYFQSRFPRSGSLTMNDYDPGPKKPGLDGSLGGNGKINYPYSRAQTYRILAPDRGPRGWGNIWVIVTWNCNFCHWFIARSANFRQTFLHIYMAHYGGSLGFITPRPHLVPLGVKTAFLCFGVCKIPNFYNIKCKFFGLKWYTIIRLSFYMKWIIGLDA